MSSIKAIDQQIRNITGEDPLQRPFICSGSPLGCEVAVVGINPGTATPFWPYWDLRTGFDRAGWLSDYVQRHGKLNPTQARLEILVEAVSPCRCIELNLYARFSESESLLPKAYQTTELFDYLLRTIRPSVLVVHGNSPADHLAQHLGVTLAKGHLIETAYLGVSLAVMQAQRHFAYVSYDYVRDLANSVKKHVQSKE